jgi:hypothetical protein
MTVRLRAFGESMSYLWKILWHPIDAIYDIVYKKKGTVLSALVIYFLYYLALVLVSIITNFIFNPYGLHGTSYSQIFSTYVLPVFVFVIGNCLVSSITQGQGTYKSVFITTAYTLAPYIVFIVPMALISNIFSNAEKSIYDVLTWFIKIWTGFFIYLGIMEVHGFSIPEAIANTLWMLFATVMVVVFALAFAGITYQSVSFLYEFVREAIGYV